MSRLSLALVAAPLAAALLAAAPARARAQTGNDLMVAGLAAYWALEYDRAAPLLRRALRLSGPEALPDSARAGLWVYLGATELMRRQRDFASAAFRQAVAADPRHRPDTLLFSPEITAAFHAARRGTRYVSVRVARDTTIVAGAERFVARLYASAPHDLVVELVSETGVRARNLYTGPIGDSLDVPWDGLDDAGNAPLAGSFALQVGSRTPQGAPLVVRVPLTVRVLGGDTLGYPPPPDSLLLPERRSAGPGLRALAAGVLGGIAVVALPAAVASEREARPARYLVGASLSIAGIIGFFRDRPGRVIPANVAANQAVRDTWRRDLEARHRENDHRRRTASLHISATGALSFDREDQ